MAFSGTDAGGFKWDGFDSGAPSQPQQPPRKQPKPRKPRKEIKSPVARIFINLAVTLVVGLVYFYLELPAITIKSPDFYAFALLLCAVYCICAVITSGFQGQGLGHYFKFLRKQCTIPFFLAVLLLATALVGTLVGSVIFRAKSYSPAPAL